MSREREGLIMNFFLNTEFLTTFTNFFLALVGGFLGAFTKSMYLTGKYGRRRFRTKEFISSIIVSTICGAALYKLILINNFKIPIEPMMFIDFLIGLAADTMIEKALNGNLLEVLLLTIVGALGTGGKAIADSWRNASEKVNSQKDKKETNNIEKEDSK